jgi:hypothetical protein
MIRGALAIAGAALALVAPAAGANSTLAYPAGTTILAVTATDPAVALSVFRFTDNPVNCPGVLCASRIELRSPQLFTESPATDQCEDVGGDASAFDCRPLPALIAVVASAGPDVVSADGGGDLGLACADPATDVRALGGDDEVTTGCADDVISGGAGADALSAGDGVNTVGGDSGDDTVLTGIGADSLAGGEGNDALAGGAGDDSLAGGEDDDALAAGAGADTLAGGAGRDRLDGGDGADRLEGGDGADVLDGGASNDVLRGGAGRDLLVPGAGTDSVEGGDGVDTVAYAERTAPVSVRLSGGADDGEAGEADSIGASVENIVAGSAGDTLIGSEVANDIDGAAGNDFIVPGTGPDFVDAGPGDDNITSRDGVQDRVDCGAGVDRLVSDEFDIAVGCESNATSRELMSDVDNDGVSRSGGDCDDRNPARRPGLPDIPENGINEDCVAGDARFPKVLATVTSNWKVVPGRRVRASRLLANDVPDTATVELRCKGGGCFRGVRRRTLPNGKSRLNLRGFVRKRRLRARAQLEVRVLRPETVGRVWRIKVSKKLVVDTTVRCLRPGASRPGACPR